MGICLSTLGGEPPTGEPDSTVRARHLAVDVAWRKMSPNMVRTLASHEVQS